MAGEVGDDTHAITIGQALDTVREVFTRYRDACGGAGGLEDGTVHQYGPVNLCEERKKCTQQFKAMLDALKAYRDWLSTGQSQRLLLHLQNKFTGQSQLKAVQAAFSHCSAAVQRAAPSPPATWQEMKTQLAQAATRDSLGMTMFEDGNTYGFGDQEVYMEVETSPSNVVQSVKVAHTPDPDRPHENVEILASLLRQGRYDEVVARLQAMRAFYSLASPKGGQRLYCAQRAVESDVLLIHNAEWGAAQDGLSLVNSGHGIVSGGEYAGSPLKITYWAPPQLSGPIGEKNNNDWSRGSAACQQLIGSAPYCLLVMEAANQTTLATTEYIRLARPDEHGTVQGLAKFVEVSPNGTTEQNAQHVLTFPEPVAACWPIISQLHSLLGKANHSQGVSCTDDEQRWLSIGCLAQDGAINQDTSITTKNGADWSVCGKLPNGRLVDYHLSTLKDDRIVHINRIPFSRPGQLLPVLKLLRRQLAFNSLFNSIFEKEASLNEYSEQAAGGSNNTEHQLVETVLEAPRSIQLASTLPHTDVMAVVHLTVSLGGSIAAALHTLPPDQRPCTDTELTEVAAKTLSIPAILSYLWHSSEPISTGAGHVAENSPMALDSDAVEETGGKI